MVLADVTQFAAWEWDQIAPYYDELGSQAVTAGNVSAWLKDWSQVTSRVDEQYTRLNLATTTNTADKEARERLDHFLDTIFTPHKAAEQRLRIKLLESGLEPAGMGVPLRNMRMESSIYRETNLPLLAEEQKLVNEYDQIVGAQTVMWEGKEITVAQLAPVYQNPDRALREQAWRLGSSRQLQDRAALNDLWNRMLTLRGRIAANAGFDSYTEYRWKELLRFDYGPAEAREFHRAIAEVVVPATVRVLERGRNALGLHSLRPWDLTFAQGFGKVVDPPGVPALHPFDQVSELEARASSMFHRVDPQLGAYFETMRREGLLDLANRKNKAPGAYCVALEASARPFIFGNSVGLNRDVQTVLHESGHAFHVFEMRPLPYYPQRSFSVMPMEFAEVGSMSMELLASPYLEANEGGFYSTEEAARALREHLESLLVFWPYMAVVDAFQHWVYENPKAASVSENCDSRWRSLWEQMMPGVDWSGLEEVSSTRWQRQLHIHADPFYYIEYGMAQLGAVLVWRNALSDQAGAVAAYRRALALGNTATLPELYRAAGARFSFDSATLGEAVALIERKLEELP